MSRTLSPCLSFPVTGSTITLPFPDLAKPVPGGWVVQVSLRATAPGSGKATIMVMQAGRIVASRDVTPGTSFGSYSLTVSESDLDRTATGLCHMSSVVVVISGTAQSICCSGFDIPAVLQGTWGSERGLCDCTDAATSTFVYDEESAAWSSSGVEFCGKVYAAILECDNDEWKCFLTAGCNMGQSITSPFQGSRSGEMSCDPFHAQFIWLDSLIAGGNPESWCCEPKVVGSDLDSLTLTITA